MTVALQRFKTKYIGDRAFYAMFLAIVLPIMLQNGISSFVGLLDNLMVGRLGTEDMSGVAIVNQILNVYYISIFGCVSGASIFGSQFFGQKNYEGQMHAFRFKMYAGILITAAFTFIFLVFGNVLIAHYLTDDGTSDLVRTATSAKAYLLIMLIGLIPNTITQVYASTLREAGQTILPMVASFIAVGINLVLNFILIFGHLGFRPMGVTGAAIATVISRFAETLIIVVFTHMQSTRYDFIKGVYRSFSIPKVLFWQIMKKGSPLFLNEFVWSFGQAALVQCYSLRGLSAVASMNISGTVFSLFNVVFMALGVGIGIVVGQQLGAGELEKAVDLNVKMTFFSVLSCFFIGVIMWFVSPLFPLMYNTTETVRSIAVDLLRVQAVFMPFYTYINSTYFTLRAGGKTVITFFFDGFYLLFVNVTVAFLIGHLTSIPVVPFFLLVQVSELMKGVVGFILIKKKVWVVNLVEELKDTV